MKISRKLARFGRKIRNIALGWFYLAILFDPPYAKKRRMACRICPYNKWNFCSLCGCALAAKCRVQDEECPDNRW